MIGQVFFVTLAKACNVITQGSLAVNGEAVPKYLGHDG